MLYNNALAKLQNIYLYFSEKTVFHFVGSIRLTLNCKITDFWYCSRRVAHFSSAAEQNVVVGERHLLVSCGVRRKSFEVWLMAFHPTAVNQHKTDVSIGHSHDRAYFGRVRVICGCQARSRATSL